MKERNAVMAVEQYYPHRWVMSDDPIGVVMLGKTKDVEHLR